MRVRRAQPDDADELARQIAVVAEEGTLGAEPPVDLDERGERFRTLIEGDDPGAVLVLEDDGGAARGHATLHPSRAGGVFTFGMLVLPEARGNGGGSMLLDALVEHARELGGHKLELEAWVDNGRAIALYAAAGFEIEGIRRNHYRRRDGSLRSTVIMARQLSD